MSSPRRLRRSPLVLACLALMAGTSSPNAARAAAVRECDFLTLGARAATIFHGKCIARREVPDGEPFPYTEYTFEVIEAAKGAVDATGKPLKTITFRHGGTRTPRARQDGLEEVPRRFGLPEYEVGEESVLFLSRESSVGLCAPIGLEQGRFAVLRRDGGTFVRNAAGKKLFARTTADRLAALQPGERAALESETPLVDIKCFLGLCRKLKVEMAGESAGEGTGGQR